jgi:uncharacterized protein YrrD
MIEIKIGVIVESGGEEIGRIERVILDREWYELTHLVIKHGGPLNPRHLLMPVSWVVRCEHDRVLIERTEDEISALPNFEIQHYVSLDNLDQEHLEHPRSKVKPSDWINYFVPIFANAFGEPFHTPGVLVTDQLLSPSESAIRRGISVESSDGHKLGEVHEIVLNEPDWRLSGIIIVRGIVLRHLMRLPADWISKIEKERIVLNRSKKQVVEWEKQRG